MWKLGDKTRKLVDKIQKLGDKMGKLVDKLQNLGDKTKMLMSFPRLAGESYFNFIVDYFHQKNTVHSKACTV
ncbi:hypothetical protein CWD94_16915 [Lysinibacillus xylanilyticus]|uniref:Uncharacterized protein n=1 Tax=Lysinibacillus xylanilyticus TaxID=582475 RepID=A0A2M9Q3D6_9BACI|nr:hypothetical protein CWD94_16915 [Lysinibacillus xylanilyticus]